MVSVILASLPYLAVAFAYLLNPAIHWWPRPPISGAHSNCSQRVRGTAAQSQPRRSSPRMVAAKLECISLTLAGGRSGASGRNDSPVGCRV